MKSVLIFLAGSLFTVVALLAIFAISVGGVYEGCDKCKTAKIQISDIGTALDFYKEDIGSYPNHLEGLSSLSPEYIKVLPVDPWGNEFLYAVYDTSGLECFLVWSLGSDGKSGGAETVEQDIFASHERGNCMKIVAN